METIQDLINGAEFLGDTLREKLWKA